MPIKPVAKTATIAAGVAALLITTAAILVDTTAIEVETDKVALTACGIGVADSACNRVDDVQTDTTAILVDTGSIETKVDTVDTVVDAIKIDTTSIDDHLHNPSRGYGLAAAVNLPTHAADRIGTGIAPFRVDASNNEWGADGTDDTWLQILGSSDTAALFGADRLSFVDHEWGSNTYFVRVAWGASGAAALAAGTVTESILRSGGGNSETGPETVQLPDIAAGTLVWVQILAYGQNTGWLDFYLEIQDHS